MGLDRRLAEVQPFGDLVVGTTAGHQTQHLGLAFGELVEPWYDGVVAGPGHELLDEAAGDRRCEQGIAGRQHPHGGDQVVRRGVLQQEAAGTGAYRLVDVVVEVERRQDQDLGAVGRVAADDASSPRSRRCRASGCPSAPHRGGGRGTARSPRGRWWPRRPPRCRVRSPGSSRILSGRAPDRRRHRLGSSARLPGRVERDGRGDAEATAGSWSGVEASAVQLDPLTHADQAVPGRFGQLS